MAASEEIGILGIDSYQYYVRNAPRSKHFYEHSFGWFLAAKSTPDWAEKTGQESMVFRGGDIRAEVITPLRDDTPSGQYLSRHPAGIGVLSFAVQDLDRAWAFLTNRGATPIHNIQEHHDDQGGQYRHFSITTPLGDVQYRFVERRDFAGFAPGFEEVSIPENTQVNPFGFSAIDHVTCNTLTMTPTKLWMEHVLGMEQCWQIEFHTQEYLPI